MPETVDARGLSCPQPVLMFMEKIKTVEKGDIEVLVDSEASKENVSRAAKSKKWTVKEVQEKNMEFRIMLSKS